MTTEYSDHPNASQVDYWNTTVGRTWARYHDALDRQIAPLGAEAIRKLAPARGECLLDVGCGCGHTTLELAHRVGTSGSILGIDISAPMLEVAAARQVPASSGRITFQQADAQVAILGAESVDAIFSRFGVMFFSNPVAAFSNLRGTLIPGGRLAFVCWRPMESNPWMAEPMNAARPYMAAREPMDPTAPGPFAFADAALVRAILERAGFQEVATTQFDARIGGGTVDEALELALRVGPLGSAIRETPELMPQVAGPVRDVLARYETPQGVLMPASVWIVTGIKCHP